MSSPCGTRPAWREPYIGERNRRLGAELTRWQQLGSRLRTPTEEKEWCLLQWRPDFSPAGDAEGHAAALWRTRPPGTVVNGRRSAYRRSRRPLRVIYPVVMATPWCNRCMSAMPAAGSDDGRRLVQTIWSLFEQVGDWPTVGQVANRLDLRHDVAFEDVLPEVPAALFYGVHPGRVPSDEETIGLTIAGAAAAQGSAEDLRLVVAAVGLAARMQQGWEPPAANSGAELTFAATDLDKEVLVPAAGRSVLLARVGALLRTENWGWKIAGHGDSSDAWTFSIDRRVRRFRGVADVADFWARAHPPLEPDEDAQVASHIPARPDILAAPDAEQTDSRNSMTKRTVFLVHGRDHEARDALIELLRAFDLKVVHWREAASRAGMGGTPHTDDIVGAGMDMADAVVVLLTPDDVGYVRSAFRQDRDGTDELRPTGQARLNVIFEAGMAMAVGRDRVVLVEVGVTRGLSDTAGIHTIRLRDHVDSRKDLAARLRDAGLTVDTDGEQWRTAGTFERPPLTPSDLSSGVEESSRRPDDGLADHELTEEELAVLQHIAKRFNAPGFRRLDTPFDVPGLTWPRIQLVLRDLHQSTPPYIEGSTVAEEDYPVVLTGVTERGRQAARVRR